MVIICVLSLMFILLNFLMIGRAIAEADTLIIGGTSLVVYPAAGFIDYFRGRHLVVINKSATAREVGAELSISAPIGEILGQIKAK